MNAHILHSFREAQDCLASFMSNAENLLLVEEIATQVAAAFRGGHKILAAGNGGSMCDAMHFAEEWSGRYRSDRAPMPALALSDPSHLSCVGNDYGFSEVFARQVSALGNAGDILFLFTTSGKSPNLLRAAEEARKKEMVVVGLLGRGGGSLKDLCTLPIVVPGETSDRIQELHIKIVHIVIEAAERALFPEVY
jgi:D-sedoheptulose 7-phosphate isomerase